MLLGCASIACGQNPVLTYNEATENVVVKYGGFADVYKYDEQKQGFVNAKGAWVAWDEKAGNWLMVPVKGQRQRYDGDGKLVWQETPKAKPIRRQSAGYDPSMDLDDSSGGNFDEAAAWDYLEQGNKIADENAVSVAGDDGGPATQEEIIGGDVAAREKKMRQEWALRPGVHSGDAEAAMETGEVVDPLKRLMDTVGQVESMVKGVSTTIDEVDAFKNEMDNFSVGDFDSPGEAAGVISDDFGLGAIPGQSAGGEDASEEAAGIPPAAGGTAASMKSAPMGRTPVAAVGSPVGTPKTGLPAGETEPSGPTSYGKPAKKDDSSGSKKKNTSIITDAPL